MIPQSMNKAKQHWISLVNQFLGLIVQRIGNESKDHISKAFGAVLNQVNHLCVSILTFCVGSFRLPQGRFHKPPNRMKNT